MFGWLYIFDQSYVFDEEGRKLQRKRFNVGGGDSDLTADLDSEEFTEKIAPMLLIFTYFLLVALIALVLVCFLPVSSWAKQLLFALYYSVFWNTPLRIYLEAYLPASNDYLTQAKEGYTWNSTLMIAFNVY